MANLLYRAWRAWWNRSPWNASVPPPFHAPTLEAELIRIEHAPPDFLWPAPTLNHIIDWHGDLMPNCDPVREAESILKEANQP